MHTYTQNNLSICMDNNKWTCCYTHTVIIDLWTLHIPILTKTYTLATVISKESDAVKNGINNITGNHHHF